MNTDTLIDTNILVYIYDFSVPQKQRRALETVNRIISEGRALLSAQVLAEFFVAVTQRIVQPLSPAEALTRIDHYSRCTKVLPVTTAVVREAARGVADHQLSYWDAQIWAIAHLHQIPVILTEDIPGQDFIEGVRYYNPLA